MRRQPSGAICQHRQYRSTYWPLFMELCEIRSRFYCGNDFTSCITRDDVSNTLLQPTCLSAALIKYANAFYLWSKKMFLIIDKKNRNYVMSGCCSPRVIIIENKKHDEMNFYGDVGYCALFAGNNRRGGSVPPLPPPQLPLFVQHASVLLLQPELSASIQNGYGCDARD